MRIQSTILILIALVASGAQAPPPPPPPSPPMRVAGAIPETGDASIGGLIKRLDTGEPLAAARVELMGFPAPSGPFAGAMSLREGSTDTAGRFVFEKLPATTYTLRISSQNFFAVPVGGASAAAVTDSITVADGQKVSNLTFILVPGGVIHGVIRDDGGNPVASVPVWALHITYRDGRKTLETVKSVKADDRGQFRFSGVPPGEYYVCASGTTNGAAPVLAYYPAGRNVESAAVVRVFGGEEIATDIRIPPAELFRISGTVVNAIPDLANEPQGFILMPRDRKIDDGTAASILPNLAGDKSSGRFELRAIPGSYYLMPAARAMGAGNFYYYTTRVPVEVRDQDVEGVVVTLTRGASLTIHVNSSAVPSFSLSNFRVGLRPVDAFPSPLTINHTARVLSTDGTAQFGVVPEGAYALVIPGTTPGVYISDIRQGARSIVDQGTITVGSEVAEPVEVVLSGDGGRIDGTVEGGEKNSTKVRVSLIPDESRRTNLLLYRRASLVQGRFILTDIPPGNYKLYAWEDLRAGADENAEFMATYETRGRAVTVRSGVALSVNALQVIRQ